MKRFISGFLCGALLFAVPAIANNSKTLEAVYNNIKLSVYGQIVDTEGNDPFIVNGRTYVPARYVAEAMGGVVKWNETENIVEVVKPEAPALTKLTSDGLEAVYRPDYGDYYISMREIFGKYNSMGFVFNYDLSSKIFTAIKSDKTSVNVPFQFVGQQGGSCNITDYENIILPFLGVK